MGQPDISFMYFILYNSVHYQEIDIPPFCGLHCNFLSYKINQMPEFFEMSNVMFLPCEGNA